MPTDKKPLQIYPNKQQRKWIEKEAKKTGLSLNQSVLQLINKEMEK